MSGLVWTLIFGVAYPLVSLAVWTVGAFGIAATAPERWEASRAASKRKYDYVDVSGGAYVLRLFGVAVLTFFAGALWPAAIPVWFGYRKGSFVADAVDKRARKDEAALSIVKGGAA